MNFKKLYKNIIYQLIFNSIAGLILILIKFVGLGDFKKYILLKQSIQFELLIPQVLLAAILLGIILGIVDTLILDRIKNRRTFGYLITVKLISYLITFILIMLIAFNINNIFFKQISLNEIVQYNLNFFPNSLHLSIISYMGTVSILASALKEINTKFGPGIFFQMLLGKYHQPKEGNRIFIFIDLKSSTTIAEKLGHIKYSKFLQDYYFDLNTILTDFRAEVYQYVGDESVLTWRIDDDKINSEAIILFLAFENAITKKSKYYLEKFGLVPEFKAGINSGSVTVAEVGEIKREIAFHGDVLNTAARVQSLCNQLSSKLLITEDYLNIIGIEWKDRFEYKDSIELRGKKEEVKIYSLRSRS